MARWDWQSRFQGRMSKWSSRSSRRFHSVKTQMRCHNTRRSGKDCPRKIQLFQKIAMSVEDKMTCQVAILAIAGGERIKNRDMVRGTQMCLAYPVVTV
jgi:hypothetical protein